MIYNEYQGDILLMKDKKKFISAAQGQRVGLCRTCFPGGKGAMPRDYRNPVRALYIREPNVGFKRVGSLFERCGHVEID